MHKLDLDLYASNTFKITYFGNEYQKKELKGNKYLILFGQLALLCQYNQDILQEYDITMQDVIEDASISDDELYLGNFEGYQISDRLTIKTLFLNTYGNVIMSVYDSKFDRFLDFVI